MLGHSGDSAVGCGVGLGVLEEHLRWQKQERAFVSLLSGHGIPLERIALLVGHSSQATTEAVYRKQHRPVITEGAEATDGIFAEDATEARE
ncbi:hypothetical protein [Streptomyces hyaluromycini]|uniref:hypothetical protein n=1 Tax=Streptomyces hyaluromycini TaxID=1377993 RepID=UPI001237F55A